MGTGAAGEAGGRKRKMSEIDARTKAIGIISGGRVQALEDAGLMIVDKQEIDRLKEKLNAVLQDFYEYVQGGKEICAFCLHDYECEPGETICGATYKGFKWRGLGAYRPKIVTNADRIRSMTDEELAQFLGDEPPYFATYKQYIDWLRKPIESEVEEG